MALGKDLHALMLRHEHADDLDAPEYLDAVLELNSRHLRRSSPYDPETLAAGVPARSRRRYMADIGPAYALWGPHEFKGTGPQAFFDISGRLGEIAGARR